MRLKPSLRNLVKNALLFSFFIFLLSLGACQNITESTYKEGDIPQIVKKICRQEYGLEVTTQRTDTTLWIYAPLTKILDKEYGVTEGKLFDPEMVEKLRNILTTIGRVLISSDNTPEFYALVASDINLGVDYTLIGYVLDIKKSYANYIPWTEANRRYVIRLNLAPEAVGDSTGTHVKTYDVKMPEFLSEQMAQRIGVKLQEEGWNKYFKVEKSEGRFANNAFVIEYLINETSKPQNGIDIREEILKIINYCLKAYEFRDFSQVELIDLAKQDRLILGRDAVLARGLKD